jgi:hypothetical protein
MTPEQAHAFFSAQSKTVLTLGFSVSYENENNMLHIARVILSGHSPETALVNIGATEGGIGAVYPWQSLWDHHCRDRFTKAWMTAQKSARRSITSVLLPTISGAESCPIGRAFATSKAMVACSDVMIGIGAAK